MSRENASTYKVTWIFYFILFHIHSYRYRVFFCCFFTQYRSHVFVEVGISANKTGKEFRS